MNEKPDLIEVARQLREITFQGDHADFEVMVVSSNERDALLGLIQAAGWRVKSRKLPPCPNEHLGHCGKCIC